MRILIGSYEVSWVGDSIVVPREYWPELAPGAVITRGLERCLFVYPRDEWRQVERAIQAWPLTRADARALSRYLLGGAQATQLDEEGRLSIPPALRDYAGLRGETLMVGLVSHAEVWDAQRWREVNAALENDAASIAERIAGRSPQENAA